MPTNRTYRTRAPASEAISEEVCAAWRAGDEMRVRDLLRIYPFMSYPARVVDEPAADRKIDTLNGETKHDMWRLHQLLLERCGPPGRSNRRGLPWAPGDDD